MNQQLSLMKDCFVKQIEEKDCVLGAWDFGSETHDLSDEYSDVDIVLLIDGTCFAVFTFSLEECLRQISDEILLCWRRDLMARRSSIMAICCCVALIFFNLMCSC